MTTYFKSIVLVVAMICIVAAGIVVPAFIFGALYHYIGLMFGCMCSEGAKFGELIATFAGGVIGALALIVTFNSESERCAS